MIKNPCDFTIPYYSLYNCFHPSFFPQHNHNAQMVARVNVPTQMMEYAQVGSSTSVFPLIRLTYVFFMAAGDDFIMGCQAGIPASKFITPPPARRRRSISFDPSNEGGLEEDDTPFNFSEISGTLETHQQTTDDSWSPYSGGNIFPGQRPGFAVPPKGRVGRTPTTMYKLD